MMKWRNVQKVRRELLCTVIADLNYVPMLHHVVTTSVLEVNCSVSNVCWLAMISLVGFCFSKIDLLFKNPW